MWHPEMSLRQPRSRSTRRSWAQVVRELFIYATYFSTTVKKHMMVTTGEGKVYSDPQFEGETSWPECLGGRNIRQQVTLPPQSGERGAPMLSSVSHVYPRF